MTEPLPASAPGARKTSVLFVCLGNICRSPAAEGCFLRLIAREGLLDSFTVDSAGTGDWHVGKPADQRMRDAAARRGIVLPSRARQIRPSDLDTFDHILTMDPDVLVCPIPSTYVETCSPALRPAVLRCGGQN